MHYRREIDGLRAVAVVPVILFHAGFAPFAGGYVGVDVFFVISGYLITSILIADLESGRFSLRRFYERRARRILPALFFVMACCLPFAWAWMLPSQFRDFSLGLIAVSLFASNVLFWRQSNYFAPAAEENPLLHTWSLAVEEQFYIFFPLLLLALWGLGRGRVLGIIGILCILSLMLAEWGWRNTPTANFYLIPTRAWELGIGAICAFVTHGRPQRSSGWLSALGLGMILAAVALFDADTPFPSVHALVPVVGTALIVLYAAPGTAVARLLSLGPVVGLGLISYSAYLWHQPLFAFARIRSLDHPDPALMAGLSVAAVALAWLSWRYVEQPFRRRTLPALPSQRAVFGASAAVGAVFLAIGAFGALTGGVPDRRAPSGVTFASLDLDSRLAGNHGIGPDCDTRALRPDLCRTGPAPRVLLWGDSYAMHLAQALQAGPGAAEIVQLTRSACAPILGISYTGGRYPPSWAAGCIAYNDRVIDWLEQAGGVDYVVMSSILSLLDAGVYSADGAIRHEGQADLVRQQMIETAARIRATGAAPVFISPPPRNGSDLSACPVKTLIFGTGADTDCAFPLDHLSPESREIDAFLETLSDEMGVILLSDLMCPDGRCMTVLDDVFLYRDAGHLSQEGSALIGQRFDLAAQVRQVARAR